MRTALVAAAGLVIGVVAVLAVGALVLGGDDGDDGDAASDASAGAAIELSFPAVEHEVAAAEDLVVAWERWRTASFVTLGQWTRTLDGSDEPLTGEVYRAQAPPQRLFIELGAITEEIDGEVVTCDAISDQVIVPDCTEITASRTFDDRVRAEMSLVLQYVLGDARIYDVGRRDGCFALELIVPDNRSPWGLAADFCFDDESGALSSSRVRRQSAVDEEITTDIRTEVTAADF